MDTKKLRQKILDLAIRGKLVPQNPNDEPASVLLERIREEKERLIKEGKIKRNKKENSSDTSHYQNLPFEVPENWVWTRLGDICEINPKNDLDNETMVSFIPMALISDGYTNKHTSEERKWEEVKKGFTHFREGDVGLAKITPCFENRKSIVFQNLENGYGAGTTELHILRPILELFLSNYIIWFVKTEAFIISGVNCFTGAVGQQRVGKNVIEETYIPLPPLAEQHRIVSEIEKLFVLIDLIEKNKLSLEQFTKQAKSKVLNLAIRGKLVPQDSTDEPASVLLERIRAKKEMQKRSSDISHYPFEVPESWVWCRLEDIGIWQSGSTPSRTNKDYYGGDILWLKTGDLTDGYIYEIPERITSKALQETSVKLNPAGSILIAMYGATIGKVGILTTPATTNQACCACSDFKGIYNLYLFHILIAYREYFIHKGEGGAQPNISKEKIVSTIIPLPPLLEQKRIVLKIEAIFQILDTISNNLQTT